MAYIKCSGCETMIDIPDELAGDLQGEAKLNEPYYCDACEKIAQAAVEASLGDDFDDEIERCPHCGKDLEDFSDLGCEYCDRRYFT